MGRMWPLTWYNLALLSLLKISLLSIRSCPPDCQLLQGQCRSVLRMLSQHPAQNPAQSGLNDTKGKLFEVTMVP